MSSSPVEYVCPTSGKTKIKTFSDGVTTLKQKHFEELIQLRADQPKLRTAIEQRNKHISESINRVNILVAERDSALTALEKENNDLKSIQVSHNYLLEDADYYKKLSESHLAALTKESAKADKLKEANTHLAIQYNKLKAGLEEQKRKNLEHEKQLVKEQKQQDSAIFDLFSQIDSYNKREMQQKLETAKNESKSTCEATWEPRFYSNQSRNEVPQHSPSTFRLHEDYMSKEAIRLKSALKPKVDLNPVKQEMPLKTKVNWTPVKEAMSPEFNDWSDWKEALPKNADRLDGISKTRYWNDDFTY